MRKTLAAGVTFVLSAVTTVFLTVTPVIPIAAAESLAMQSCYGSAKSYSTTKSSVFYPPGWWLSTTSNCSDINLKSAMNRNVRVCFLTSSQGVACQQYWTLVTSEWTVVAFDVQDNSVYKFEFASAQNSGGSYAA